MSNRDMIRTHANKRLRSMVPSFENRYDITAEYIKRNRAMECKDGFTSSEEMYRWVEVFMETTRTEPLIYLTEGGEFGLVVVLSEEFRPEDTDEEECYSLFFNEGTHFDSLHDVSRHTKVTDAIMCIGSLLAIDNGFNQ